MGILVKNSDFELIWGEPYPEVSFDAQTYTLTGEVGTTLSCTFAVFDNKDVDVTDQCEITLSNDNVSIENGMFICDDLEVGEYTTEVTATYSYLSATVTATATINIAVEEEKPTSISFDSNAYTMEGTEGETITETFTVTDNLGNLVTSQCTYALSPSNTGLTASNGTFDASAVLAGAYTVTVTATYGELTTTATVGMDIAASSFADKYLTFEALESGTFTLTIPTNISSVFMTSVSYSTDNGATWVDTTVDSTAQTITTPTIAQGGKVLWKGVGTQMSTSDSVQYASHFSSTGNFNVSGNIMSLLYGDNFVEQTTFNATQNVFASLFNGAAKLVDAENLVLPATTLVRGCYHSMFYGCTSLTTVPSDLLPATTIQQECYNSMFSGCTSLTVAPELPATTLAGSNCYSYMFYNCTSLTAAPALPATTLISGCYVCMFKKCTSLTTAPTLSATTLVFNGYASMFENCSNLTSITMLATDISASNCLKDWVKNVAASGTLTKAAAQTSLPSGNSGIPSGWTVVDA